MKKKPMKCLSLVKASSKFVDCLRLEKKLRNTLAVGKLSASKERKVQREWQRANTNCILAYYALSNIERLKQNIKDMLAGVKEEGLDE